MVTKQDIRIIALLKRNQLTKEEQFEKSKQITNHILALKEYQNATEILCYASYKSEVKTDLLAMISLKLGKKVYYPVVLGADIQFYPIKGLMDLHLGYQGIREPKLQHMPYQSSNHKKVGFVIVPGCGFDEQNQRIGYGKGFYDRYLQREASLYKVLVAYECQRMDSVLAEPYDVPMNKIITEQTF